MNFNTLGILLLEEKSKPRSGKTEKAKKGIDNAYKKVMDVLEDTHDDDEKVSQEKLEALNVSDHMKKKMLIWFQQGKKPKPRSKAKQLILELTKIMGIGKSTATKLVESGLTNINQLRSKKWKAMLNSTTKAFMELEPNEKIRYADIECLEKHMRQKFKKYKWYIVGSYRRGTKYSADIDILIVDPNDDHIQAFTDLRDYFSEISDVAHGYSKGPKKLSMIVDIGFCAGDQDDSKENIVKVDVFLCKPENEIPMLLYGTGPKDLTIQMRTKLKRGIEQDDKSIRKYKLDQYTLWDITDPKKHISVPVTTEKDIFDIAGMEYQEPDQR